MMSRWVGSYPRHLWLNPCFLWSDICKRKSLLSNIRFEIRSLEVVRNILCDNGNIKLTLSENLSKFYQQTSWYHMNCLILLIDYQYCGIILIWGGQWLWMINNLMVHWHGDVISWLTCLLHCNVRSYVHFFVKCSWKNEFCGLRKYATHIKKFNSN